MMIIKTKSFFFTILLSTLLFSACKNSMSRESNSLYKVLLSERTRGTNRLFTITSKEIQTSLNGNSIKSEITKNQNLEIKKLVENISLETISKLESPSTKRFSDGALSTTITIIKNDKEYKSSDFDSGNPPAELKSLYDEIQKLTATKKSK